MPIHCQLHTHSSHTLKSWYFRASSWKGVMGFWTNLSDGPGSEALGVSAGCMTCWRDASIFASDAGASANGFHDVGGTNLTENLKEDTRSRQGSAIAYWHRVERRMAFFDLSLVEQLLSIHCKRTYLLGSNRSHPQNTENWETGWILIAERLVSF